MRLLILITLLSVLIAQIILLKQNEVIGLKVQYIEFLLEKK